MYKFSFTLNEKDYIEFNKYHIFNSPESKKNMLIYRIFFAILFIIFGLILGKLADEPLSYSFYISFGIITILWLILFTWFVELQLRIKLRILKKCGRYPYPSNLTIFFENDFLVCFTEEDEIKVKYSAIERIIVNEKVIYIYTNGVQVLLLPLIVFFDEQDCDEFLNFIEEKREVINEKCV